MKKQQRIIKYFLCRNIKSNNGSYHIIVSTTKPYMTYQGLNWTANDYAAGLLVSFFVSPFEAMFPLLKLEPGYASRISFREMKKAKGMLIRFIGKKFKG